MAGTSPAMTEIRSLPFFKGTSNESHILSGLAIRAKWAHCRDLTRPNRQNRVDPYYPVAGPPQRRIFAHQPREKTAGADNRQWRGHRGLLCHRRISRRARRWRQADPGVRRHAMEGQERSFAAAGHARFDAAVPLRENGTAGAAAVAGVGRRSLESRVEWHGAFREADRDAVAAPRHRADRADLRARL